MKPLKAELDALDEVLHTPLGDFITDAERAKHDEEKLERLAKTRMFTRAIEAVDDARSSRGYYSVVFETIVHTYEAIGPYSTAAQAKAAFERDIAPNIPIRAYAIVPTHNPQNLLDRLAKLDEPAQATGDWAAVRYEAEMFKAGWKGNKKDRVAYERKVGSW